MPPFLPQRLAKLPQELIDMIIDILGAVHDRSLTPCSLVCHAWYPRCRAYIHDTIRVHEGSNADRLSQVYSRPSRVAHLVQSLAIDAGDPDAREDADDVDHSWLNTPPMLLLLNGLDNVVKLTLYGLTWGSSDVLNDDTKKAIMHLKGVQNLHMNSCYFPDPRDLVRLLQSFTQLKTVQAESVCAELEEHEDISDALRDNVEDLTLDFLDISGISQSETLVRWAYACRARVSIERINLVWSNGELSSLGELLQISGPSIQSLSLTLRKNAGCGTGAAKKIRLSRCTELRKFALHLMSKDCSEETETETESCWVAACIGQLSSVNLHSISLEVDVKDKHEAESVDWQLIDTTLANYSKALSIVEIGILGYTDIVNFPLPKLKDRKILYILQQYA